MWDSLYNILFNPNHEMSMPIILSIIVIVMVFNYCMQAYVRYRERHNRGIRSTQQQKRKKK